MTCSLLFLKGTSHHRHTCIRWIAPNWEFSSLGDENAARSGSGRPAGISKARPGQLAEFGDGHIWDITVTDHAVLLPDVETPAH